MNYRAVELVWVNVDKDGIGRRIRRIREDLSLDEAALAELSGLSLQDIQAIESGVFELRPIHLMQLAEALHWDWEELLRPRSGGVEDDLLPLFRKNSDLRPEDRFALLDMAKRASLLEGLGRAPRLKAPSIPPNPKATFDRGEGRRIAMEVRRKLNLEGPIWNPFDLCRDLGIQLFRVELATPNMSGVTLFHKSFEAAIVIRSGDDLFRQCFSAMHELGHVVMDREKGSLVSYEKSDEAAERRANGFASGMLLPTDEVQAKWEEVGEDWEAWRSFFVAYRVNPTTIFTVLRDVGCIRQSRCDSLFRNPPPPIRRAEKVDPDRLWVSIGWDVRLRAIAELGLSPELAEAAEEALKNEEYSWARMSEELRIGLEDLREFLRKPPGRLKQPLHTNINTKFAS